MAATGQMLPDVMSRMVQAMYLCVDEPAAGLQGVQGLRHALPRNKVLVVPWQRLIICSVQFTARVTVHMVTATLLQDSAPVCLTLRFMHAACSKHRCTSILERWVHAARQGPLSMARPPGRPYRLCLWGWARPPPP